MNLLKMLTGKRDKAQEEACLQLLLQVRRILQAEDDHYAIIAAVIDASGECSSQTARSLKKKYPQLAELLEIIAVALDDVEQRKRAGQGLAQIKRECLAQLLIPDVAEARGGELIALVRKHPERFGTDFARAMDGGIAIASRAGQQDMVKLLELVKEKARIAHDFVTKQPPATSVTEAKPVQEPIEELGDTSQEGNRITRRARRMGDRITRVMGIDKGGAGGSDHFGPSFEGLLALWTALAQNSAAVNQAQRTFQSLMSASGVEDVQQQVIGIAYQARSEKEKAYAEWQKEEKVLLEKADYRGLIRAKLSASTVGLEFGEYQPCAGRLIQALYYSSKVDFATLLNTLSVAWPIGARLTELDQPPLGGLVNKFLEQASDESQDPAIKALLELSIIAFQVFSYLAMSKIMDAQMSGDIYIDTALGKAGEVDRALQWGLSAWVRQQHAVPSS